VGHGPAAASGSTTTGPRRRTAAGATSHPHQPATGPHDDLQRRHAVHRGDGGFRKGVLSLSHSLSLSLSHSFSNALSFVLSLSLSSLSHRQVGFSLINQSWSPGAFTAAEHWAALVFPCLEGVGYSASRGSYKRFKGLWGLGLYHADVTDFAAGFRCVSLGWGLAYPKPALTEPPAGRNKKLPNLTYDPFCVGLFRRSLTLPHTRRVQRRVQVVGPAHARLRAAQGRGKTPLHPDCL
jgi:hypothetical protein